MEASSWCVKKFVIGLYFLLIPNLIFGQVVVTNNTNPTQLAQDLAGPGVTVSNATFSGGANSAGTFTATNSNLGINEGVVLSTTNPVSGIPGTPGQQLSNSFCSNCYDSDMDSLTGSSPVRDVTILEFDVTPIYDTLKFNYVFASEEYLTYICSINDAFGFFISGPGISGSFSNNSENIALIPGTTTPVSINNVHPGNPGCPAQNAQYYVSNNATSNTVKFNGFTTVFTAIKVVQPCQTYHLKLAIADASDGLFDSGVFIEAGSLSSSGVTLSSGTSVPSVTNAVEGCVDGTVTFTRTTVNADSFKVNFGISGSATNGVDYITIPDSVIILPNQASTTINISPIADGIAEGMEEVMIYLTEPCKNTITDSVIITILDSLPATVSSGQTICFGNSVKLSASGGTSYQWTPSSGLSNDTIASPTASPADTTTYTVEVKIGSCSSFKSVTVNVNSPPTVSAGQDTSMCMGQSIKLNGSSTTPGVTYHWSPSAGLSNAFQKSPLAYPSSTTSYTLTVTDNAGCTNKDTMLLTVASTPTATGGPDQAICPGDSVQLSASGGLYYTWSPAIGLSNSNIANPYAFPATTTIYTLTVSNGTNCEDTSLVKVTVYPTVNIDAGQDKSVCNGGSVNLNGSGAASYQWSPASTLNNPYQSGPVATPSSNTTYTLTGTDANGCTGTDSVNVILFHNDFLSVSGDTSICVNSSVTISASGGVSYNWTPAGFFNDPSLAAPTVTPSGATTFVVNATDINGCTDNDSLKVSLYSLPAVSATPLDTTICISNTVQVNVSGANSYTWSPVSGLNSNTISNPLANPSATTTYTVTGTDNNGCINIDSVTINVDGLPIADAGADDSLCISSSTILNGSGGAYYTWSPSAGLSDPSIANPVSGPTQTTTYTLLVSNGPGCEDYDSTTITVLPLPVVNAGINDSICAGDSITLNGSGGVSYSWSPAASLSDSSIANPVAFPGVTTTYTLTATDLFGCSNTATVTIKVNPLPSASAGIDQTICPGTTTNLSASGGISYTWSPSAGLNDPNIHNPTATVNSSTNFTVNVTDAKGCTAIDEVSISTHIVAQVDAGLDSSLCFHDNVQLNASGVNSYKWFPSSGLSDSTISNPIASPSTTTTYTVEGIDNNGCVSTDQVTIMVHSLPVAVIQQNDTTLCIGDKIQLDASGGGNYEWMPFSGGKTPKTPSIIISITSTQTYSVAVTNGNSCADTAEINITALSLPVANAGQNLTICPSTSVNLIGTGGGAYSWSPSASLSNSNSAATTATPSGTTKYTLEVTGSNGCTARDSVLVTVFNPPSVNAGADTAICIGESLTLLGSGLQTYSWSPAGSLNDSTLQGPQATPFQTTIFTLTGIDTNNCTGTAQVEVTVNPLPNIILGQGDTSICIGENINLQASGGVSYNWSPAASLVNPLSASPVANPSVATIYTVNVTNQYGCEDQSTVEVNFYPYTDPSAGPEESFICPGDRLQLSAANGVNFIWSPSTGMDDPTFSDPIATPQSDIVYSVIIEDKYGCTSYDSVAVYLYTAPYADAGLDQTIYKGESISLFGSGNGDFLWSPSGSLNDATLNQPLAAPDTTTNYVLTVTTPDGCVSHDSMQLEVKYETKAYVPTAFTPNNDGKNDVFYFQSYHEFELTAFKIFNRWGQLVFKTNNISEGWDGTTKGVAQPMGTYIYIVDGVGNRGEKFHLTGNLTLLR